MKEYHSDLDICVFEAAASAGDRLCSATVVEPEPLEQLLDLADASWRDTEQARDILGRQVAKDDLVMLLGEKCTLRLNGAVSLAKVLGLRLGRLTYRDNYIVSAGELTDWLCQIAVTLGVEVRWGCRAEKIRKNSLRSRSDPVYALSLTELIQVQSQQYEKLGNNRIVNVLSSGLSGLMGSDCMSGRAAIYPMGHDRVALSLIAAANADDGDGQRQELFDRFKRHSFVRQFIAGGTIREASSRMIPARGFYALPRNPVTGAIGKTNVLIAGDSAGFVHVLKGTSLPHALASGWAAGMAVAQTLLSDSERIAEKYSETLEMLPLYRQMYALRQVRGLKPDR